MNIFKTIGQTSGFRKGKQSIKVLNLDYIKICSSKDTIRSMKCIPLWKNILFVLTTNKGLIYKIYIHQHYL